MRGQVLGVIILLNWNALKDGHVFLSISSLYPPSLWCYFPGAAKNKQHHLLPPPESKETNLNNKLRMSFTGVECHKAMLNVSTSRPWPWPEVRSLNFLYLTAITALLFLGHCDATYFPGKPICAQIHDFPQENLLAIASPACVRLRHCICMQQI